ncbi:hypothetical protein, partial [Burkholderia multivorans]
MTIAMPHTDPLRPQSPTAGLPAPTSGPAESEGTAESAGPASSPTLLSAVGLGYFPLAFLARLPYAMVVVGVLTLVVAGRESLSLGGLNSAMVGLG